MFSSAKKQQQSFSEKKFNVSGSFEILSNEMFLYLFSFLGPEEWCRLSLVSKQFNLMANDDSLWNQFVCESSDASSELGVRAFLQQNPTHISEKYLSISIFHNAYETHQKKIAQQQRNDHYNKSIRKVI